MELTFLLERVGIFLGIFRTINVYRMTINTHPTLGFKIWGRPGFDIIVKDLNAAWVMTYIKLLVDNTELAMAA